MRLQIDATVVYALGPAYDKIKQNIGAANFDKWMEMAEATK